MSVRNKFIKIRVSEDEQRKYLEAFRKDGKELSDEARKFFQRIARRAEKREVSK